MVSYTAYYVSQMLTLICLNPCCSGQWSRTFSHFQENGIVSSSLNPCCSGQWSRTLQGVKPEVHKFVVLILVVVDNGLVHDIDYEDIYDNINVLILVVVDNGLVHLNYQSYLCCF